MKKAELKELIRNSILEGDYLEDDPKAVEALEDAESEEMDSIAEADAIVEAWNAKKQPIQEEMHGGYLELFEMDPNFEQAIALLDQAWEEWKNGPATSPEDIPMAKEDILAYLSRMLN